MLSWPFCFGPMMVHLGGSLYGGRQGEPFCKPYLLKFHSSAMLEIKMHGPVGTF